MPLLLGKEIVLMPVKKKLKKVVGLICVDYGIRA